MKRALVWLLLLSAAACDGARSPWDKAPEVPIDLRIAVAPQQVALLQPIEVTLDLFVRTGLEVEFAPTVDKNDFLVVATERAPSPLFDGTWRRTTLRLQPVRGPGELVLPPFTAKQKGGDVAASTPEQRIEVLTSLPDAPPNAELPTLVGDATEPVGAPFPTPLRPWPWLLGGAAVLGLCGAWWWWRARQVAVEHAHAVALPPHVRALRELQRLQGLARTTRPEVERFYVDVSMVLRVYLEERFSLRAPERTTEEFLRELEGGSALARDHRGELERFLRQCDLVKFAAFAPTDSDHQATWQLAVGFVEATRADASGGADAATAVPPTAGVSA